MRQEERYSELRYRGHVNGESEVARFSVLPDENGVVMDVLCLVKLGKEGGLRKTYELEEVNFRIINCMPLLRHSR